MSFWFTCGSGQRSGRALVIRGLRAVSDFDTTSDGADESGQFRFGDTFLVPR